jgi:hypothetical protein
MKFCVGDLIIWNGLSTTSSDTTITKIELVKRCGIITRVSDYSLSIKWNKRRVNERLSLLATIGICQVEDFIREGVYAHCPMENHD